MSADGGEIETSETFGPPEGNLIMAIAEKYGQLPDTVEREMSEYWLNRVAVAMEAEAIDQKRRNDEMKDKMQR